MTARVSTPVLARHSCGLFIPHIQPSQTTTTHQRPATTAAAPCTPTCGTGRDPGSGTITRGTAARTGTLRTSASGGERDISAPLTATRSFHRCRCTYEDDAFTNFTVSAINAHDPSQPFFLYFAPVGCVGAGDPLAGPLLRPPHTTSLESLCSTTYTSPSRSAIFGG